MSRRVLVCAALIAITGCSKKSAAPTDQEVRAKLAPVIKKHPDAKIVFEALTEADHDALEAKPVKEAKPIAKKLEVPGSLLDQSNLEGEGVLVGSPGFAVGTQSESDLKLSFWPRVPDVAKCRDLFGGGLWGTDQYVQPKAVEFHLERLEAVHHVIFIRVREYTEPHAEFNEFTPGEARGDVLVYALPKGKRVAAYPLEVVQKLEKASVQKAKQNADLELMFKSEIVQRAIDLVATGASE